METQENKMAIELLKPYKNNIEQLEEIIYMANKLIDDERSRLNTKRFNKLFPNFKNGNQTQNQGQQYNQWLKCYVFRNFQCSINFLYFLFY